MFPGNLHCGWSQLSQSGIVTMYPKTFTFLNLIGDFKSWNDVSHGMLWAYNLNYMDWLLQPDMTFEQGSEWVERFITDLPTNRIDSDPDPIALRSIKLDQVYRQIS